VRSSYLRVDKVDPDGTSSRSEYASELDTSGNRAARDRVHDRHSHSSRVEFDPGYGYVDPN